MLLPFQVLQHPGGVVWMARELPPPQRKYGGETLRLVSKGLNLF